MQLGNSRCRPIKAAPSMRRMLWAASKICLKIYWFLAIPKMEKVLRTSPILSPMSRLNSWLVQILKIWVLAWMYLRFSLCINWLLNKMLSSTPWWMKWTKKVSLTQSFNPYLSKDISNLWDQLLQLLNLSLSSWRRSWLLQRLILPTFKRRLMKGRLLLNS